MGRHIISTLLIIITELLNCSYFLFSYPAVIALFDEVAEGKRKIEGKYLNSIKTDKLVLVMNAGLIKVFNF